MIRIKKIILFALILGAAVLITAGGNRSVEYARQSLDICLDVIIPSLFPFFVCSGLLVYSGFCGTLSIVFRPIMKPLFNVGGAGAGAFVLGIVSGYPLGALTACRLYEGNYLSKTEAERLMSFCNNSGPLFILGAVGVSLYSSPALGALLYGAHILACITVGILFRFYKMREYNAYDAPVTTVDMNKGEIFSAVISSSVNSILIICGTVIFFGTVTVLALDLIPAEGMLRAFLAGLCEFVTGTNAISQTQATLWEKLVASAFIIGFAGLSVHMQVLGVTAKYGLSLKPYIFGKLLHGTFSALYIWLFLHFFNPVREVFANTALDINGGFAVSAALLSVCAAASVCAGSAVLLLGALGGGLKRMRIRTKKTGTRPEKNYRE